MGTRSILLALLLAGPLGAVIQFPVRTAPPTAEGLAVWDGKHDVLMVGTGTGTRYLVWGDRRGRLISYGGDTIDISRLPIAPVTDGDVTHIPHCDYVYDFCEITKAYWNEVNDIPIDGNDLGVDGAGRLHTKNHHLQFNIRSPADEYDNDPNITVWAETDAAITIKSIKLTCNKHPAVELDADLCYADARIGLASATVIHALDTTNGVFSSGAETLAVPSGKCIYIVLNAQPDSAITEIPCDITYE